MESPAWLPRREVKPPPTSTEAGIAADTSPSESSVGDKANCSYSVPAATFSYNVTPNMSSGADKSSAVSQVSAPLAAPILSQSVSLPLHSPSSSSMNSSLFPNLGPTTSQAPTTDPFFLPPGLARTPGAYASQGLAPSAPMAHPYVAVDSSPSGVQRPIMPTMPPSNAVQQQAYPTYPYLPAMAAPSQAPWMHPPPMGGMPRHPFLPYPAAFRGPFPLPGHGIYPPSASLPDSQPPGVVPVGTAGANPMLSSASFHQLPSAPGMQTELPPGIDNHNHLHHSGTKDNAADSEPFHAWTAHKTDTGVVYYYNAVTGVSTYEKPPWFKEMQSEKVPVQPTPVSMENLFGTDWALITTNDGKKYYHNNKTKCSLHFFFHHQLSSWQIPSEVKELRKNQEADLSKEQAISVSQLNALTEKGSDLISLSATAVNTSGCDATVLRASSVPGASSALDLVKKKLQDSGPAISAPVSVSSGGASSQSNGSRVVEAAAGGLPSENRKDKLKGANGDGNISDSSTDSGDEDDGPTKEECIIKFKEMLKERGVAPFSKWEKELPKIVFDPRFKAIPSHSARRSLFEHYVKTRAEEERKEKRAAQKAAVEGFKQLQEEASEDIDHNTDYQIFRKKWGNDTRFEALDRKDREHLLNERILLLKKAAQEKAQAERASAVASFKSMLRDKGDITVNSRWSRVCLTRVKDSLRNDPRYKSVKHEDREVFFNEYLSELKAAVGVAERDARGKREEQLSSTSIQEKLKERERELRKRKEREEQEMERVRVKVRRKEAVVSFQALLVETIKDPQASWTESKPRLEKDPQGRASNPDLESSDIEKLFREHIKMLHERCTNDFKDLLAEVITAEAAAQKTEDGKTVLDSWSTSKRLLKPDPRYNKFPRKERETLWRRYAEEMLRKQKSSPNQKEYRHADTTKRSSNDSGRYQSGSRKTNDRR
ncbi:hypothetical protein SADUNF_Sadunf08G0068100 [Salix dunnii]|uniref:Pre-mRNA-processing protein 40C n=1 Tax=Salix dunnii TaxID=1413687 RepID=A0A835JXP3_9ROSI|nr:hypothetical protein SADUNF_Sadunf08G0068100 [Salix dunnii]